MSDCAPCGIAPRFTVVRSRLSGRRLVGFVPISECKYRALFPFLQTFLHFFMFILAHGMSYFGHYPRKLLSLSELRAGEFLAILSLFRLLWRRVVASCGVGSSGRGSSGCRVVGRRVVVLVYTRARVPI